MVSNAAQMVLSVLLLHAAVKVVQGPQGTNLSLEPLWALEVMTLESTQPTALWVGLINRSSEARLICVVDRGVSYTEKDGTSKALMEGASPHKCDGDEQFQLVREGQTQFIRLRVPEKLTTRVSGRIRVEVGIVDRPVAGDVARREPVGVAWEGTLSEAAKLGRALTTAAPRGR